MNETEPRCRHCSQPIQRVEDNPRVSWIHTRSERLNWPHYHCVSPDGVAGAKHAEP